MTHYRAEILSIFRSYFGSNDYFINSFWNLLTFSGEQLISLNSNKHWQKYSSPRVQCSVVQTDPSFSLPALARLINFVINSFSLNDWRREPAPKAFVFKGHTICRFGQTLSRNYFFSVFLVWSRSTLVSLTRLTWLIHTSFLPSKWNLYLKMIVKSGLEKNLFEIPPRGRLFFLTS